MLLVHVCVAVALAMLGSQKGVTDSPIDGPHAGGSWCWTLTKCAYSVVWAVGSGGQGSCADAREFALQYLFVFSSSSSS